ncbi:hypothetical protein HY522_12020 [bacterium]|nr:hypothetical protein [bacterium]
MISSRSFFGRGRRLLPALAAAASAFLLIPAVSLGQPSAAYLKEGKTLYEKGRLGEALRAFEAAGDDPEALYFQFRIYIEDLVDTVSAHSMAEQLQKKFPGSAQAARVMTLMRTVPPPEPAPPKRMTTPPAVKDVKPAVAKSAETAPVSTKSEPKAEIKAPKKPESKEEKAPVPEKPEPPKAAEKPAAPPEPPKPPKPEPIVQVNLTADVKDFLKGISELTGENILYDPSVSGQVIMSGPADVPMSQVMDLTRQILGMRGYTLVKMDQGWKVVASSVALRGNIPTHSTQTSGLSQEYITQVIRLDPRLSSNEIRGILATYVSPNNNFQVLPKLNLILLTDTRETIDKVLDLIRRLGELQGEVTFKYFTLKYAKVQDIKTRLDALLATFLGKADYLTIPIVEVNQLWVAAQPEDISRIESLLKEMDTDFSYDVQLTVLPLKYASEEAVAKLVGELLQVGAARYAAENFKIIPDSRRRSVILSSVSPRIIALVSKLVAEIDQPSVPRAENIHIYKIGNADALKIADKLNTLYKDQTGADRIGIVADEQSNSLIITANAQRYAELETVIKKLDYAKSQVWLEVYVVEASLDKSKSIGVQWLLDKTDSVRGRTLTGAAGILTGVNKGSEGFSVGVAQAGSDFGATFNAMLKDEDFNVLSTPHLLVKDNELAKISVGDVIPILQNSQVTPTGSVTRTFNFENVGTNLSITPHVNDPHVTLDFTMAVQEVKSIAEIGAPTRTNRDLSTTITIDHGQTAVLGGILGKRKSFGRSGVPIVSKLPLIGWLFRKDVYADKLTNLLIFITPKIVNTVQDLEKISLEKQSESPERVAPPGASPSESLLLKTP